MNTRTYMQYNLFEHFLHNIHIESSLEHFKHVKPLESARCKKVMWCFWAPMASSTISTTGRRQGLVVNVLPWCLQKHSVFLKPPYRNIAIGHHKLDISTMGKSSIHGVFSVATFDHWRVSDFQKLHSSGIFSDSRTMWIFLQNSGTTKPPNHRFL